MKTSIVILTYNKLEYTMECVDSIRSYTKPESYELIVVDNASSDGTIDWLSAQEDIILIKNDTNLGFPKGCNQGIEVASGDYVLLLNNDTVVTTNWLDNLLEALNSDERIGAVSCVTNNCGYYQAIPVTYNNSLEMQEFAQAHNISDSSKWEERINLIGFCMLIKKSVVDGVGPLDEQFAPGNLEDVDYSVRIRLLGYKLLLCKDTFIHHYGGVSFKDNSNEYDKLLMKNRVKFEEKWGFNAAYSNNIRHQIVDKIQANVGQKLNILDVGCACGGTLLKIKDVYKNSNLYGIELNEHSAKVASLVAEVSVMNIEEADLSYPNAYFDVIIFADVLEHLNDPWKVLIRMKKYLKPDGRLLISLPNVMHKSVIHSLLHGRWSYTDAGILDRTHLRFFTLYEIRKMLHETGYITQNVTGSKVATSPEEDELINHLAQVVPQNAMEQFNVYQYIVSARNNEHLHNTYKDILQAPENKEAHVNELQVYSLDEIMTNSIHVEENQRAKLLNIIAVSHFEMGEFERVIPLLEKSLSISEDPEVLYNMAYILYYLGEYEVARIFEKKLSDTDINLYDQLVNLVSDFIN